MKSLCESRGVKFLLVTQKIFLNNTYYKIMSSESKILKYYKLMDEYTLKSIDDIVKSDLLSNIDILEMHKQFPDKWNDKSIRKIKSIFPDRNIDFKQLMSYDSMHFSPSGCFLFSAIVSDKINKIIN